MRNHVLRSKKKPRAAHLAAWTIISTIHAYGDIIGFLSSPAGLATVVASRAIAPYRAAGGKGMFHSRGLIYYKM